MDEVKEKNEVSKSTKMVRFDISLTVHSKILTHQADLIGQKRAFVTFADACADLLNRATKDIQPAFKYSIGQLVWYRSNGEDPDQFQIENNKLINGHPCYLVDGKYVHENLLIA